MCLIAHFLAYAWSLLTESSRVRIHLPTLFVYRTTRHVRTTVKAHVESEMNIFIPRETNKPLLPL